MSRVAFIGLGAMGSRMACRLLDAGYVVTVWNRTQSKADPLAARGATVSASPAQAASQADVIITMVATPAALQAVTEGPTGIASGLSVAAAGRDAAATVIEMSTVGPPAIARLASILPEGVGLLDAPVLGSLAEAESGALAIFVGGPAPLAERWRPLQPSSWPTLPCSACSASLARPSRSPSRPRWFPDSCQRCEMSSVRRARPRWG